MSESDGHLQREIAARREKALKILDEARWIRRQLPDLPYLKRCKMMKIAADLEKEAAAEEQKSLALENRLS